MDYQKRLIVPITANTVNLFSKDEAYLLTGYERIVIGKRGPYVECNLNQIIQQNFHIPKNEAWRIQPSFNNAAYYIEYRSNDKSNVKLYYQLKPVDYADYKIGMYYVSPFELYLENKKVLIEPLRKK